jgi:hypothetical protein
MKSSINALFVDVKNGKAFFSKSGENSISLKNLITDSSLVRIANLTYNPKMATHFVEPQWIAIHRK